MKMQGYNGSQLWDTAFSAQAIVEALCLQSTEEVTDTSTVVANHASSEVQDTLSRIQNYLEVSQVITDTPNRERLYRHISKGAWPFSSRDHGWPISGTSTESACQSNRDRVRFEKEKWAVFVK